MNKYSILLIVLFLNLGCSANNNICDLDANCYMSLATEKYQNNKKYDTEIIDNLTKAAELNNSEAQYKLGSLYSIKNTEFYDLNKAKFWLDKQIRLNNFDAAFMLASALAEQDIIDSKSNEEAERLFILAKQSKKFSLDAYESLAYLYFSTQKKLYDPHKSYKYSMDASQKGISSAQNILGTLYRDGEGTKKNIDQAIYWFEKASMQNDINAINNLAIIYLDQKKYDKSLYLFEKAYDLGSKRAAYFLGDIYFKGLYGQAQDKIKGVKLIKESLEAGINEANQYLYLINNEIY